MSSQKTLTSSWHFLVRLLLDGVFPHRCYGCSQYDTLLCEKCLRLLPRRSPAIRFFDTSKKEVFLDSLTSPLFFQTPILSLCIHDYKFQGITSLTKPFAQLLLKTIEQSPLRLPTFVTEVPLHPKRLRDRGYNQSTLLAHELTRLINTPSPITEHRVLLKRTKNTSPQSKQPDRRARLEAMHNAFDSEQDSPSLHGAIIWLIDDVATTHATLEACAKILKQAGAKEVHGIVIAR